MPAQITAKQFNPRGGNPTAATAIFNIANETVALNTFATVPGAAVTIDTDGAILCTGTPSANGQHFGFKIEKASGTWDLSDAMIAFDVEFLDDSAAGRTGPGHFGIYPEIWLCMDSGTTFTNYYRYVMGAGITKISGRQTLLAPKNRFVATGAANFAAVKRIEIRFSTDANFVRGLHRIKVHGFYQDAQTRSTVVLGFDDQYSSVYTLAYPLMEAYGYKGTMYVQPSAVGASGRMTWAQLQELADAGWTIGSHPYQHKPLTLVLSLTWSAGVVTATSLSGDPHGFNTGDRVPISHAYDPEFNGTFPITKISNTIFTYPQPVTPINTTARGFMCTNWLSTDQIRYYVQTSIDLIYKNLTGPNIRPDIFAYTNGAFSDVVVGVLTDMKLTCARTTATGAYPGAGFMNWSTDAWIVNKYRHPSATMDGAATGAALLSYLDTGIPFGAMGQVYGHQVGAGGDISQAEYQIFLDGLRLRQNRGEIDVKTQAQVCAMLGLQREI